MGQPSRGHLAPFHAWSNVLSRAYKHDPEPPYDIPRDTWDPWVVKHFGLGEAIDKEDPRELARVTSIRRSIRRRTRQMEEAGWLSRRKEGSVIRLAEPQYWSASEYHPDPPEGTPGIGPYPPRETVETDDVLEWMQPRLSVRETETTEEALERLLSNGELEDGLPTQIFDTLLESHGVETEWALRRAKDELEEAGLIDRSTRGFVRFVEDPSTHPAWPPE